MANSAVARSARLNTAMTAVYAGPLLDILIALPTGFWVLLSRDASASTAVDAPAVSTGGDEATGGLEGVQLLTPVVAVAAGFLIVHSVATLMVARVNGNFLPRWFGRVATVTYVMYLTVVVVLIVS